MTNDDDDDDDFSPQLELELQVIANLAMGNAEDMLNIAITQWRGIQRRASMTVSRAMVMGKGHDAAEIMLMMTVAVRATAFVDIIERMRDDPEMIALIEPDPTAVEATYQELLAEYEAFREARN
jgi:hypothetical protein